MSARAIVGHYDVDRDIILWRSCPECGFWKSEGRPPGTPCSRIGCTGLITEHVFSAAVLGDVDQHG